MSYATIHRSVYDDALMNRVTACCAQEGADNPPSVAGDLIWDVCTATDIEAAYASALAANNPNPGADETVITDAMILSAVQANTPAP